MSQVTQQSYSGTLGPGDTADRGGPKDRHVRVQQPWASSAAVNRYQNPDATANLVAIAMLRLQQRGRTHVDRLRRRQQQHAERLQSGPTTPWAIVATSSSTLDGTVSYTNDSTGQLTGASGGQAPSESYVYDANGNRRRSPPAAMR